MKKILITGKDSYIGTSVEKWLLKDPDKYTVDTMDMKDPSWKEKDFSNYDVVFHVAGIAHIKETADNQDLYYKVNRDLAYETAQKAKQDGVDQFIFLSSMSIYGVEQGVIHSDTPLSPNSAYGKSKVEAEELINKLQGDSFTVATLRPPMVYGKGCRGNYPRLAKLAKKTPIFPLVNNQRSMIYIDNLTQFVKQIIDDKTGGVFFPQNKDYVNTSEMVEIISRVNEKPVWMIRYVSPFIKYINASIFNKVFGDLIYEKSLSYYGKDYSVCDFEESIKKTESS